MIKFPESVCAKAYEDLDPGQNCVIEQITSVLGGSKKHVEELTDESAKTRYAHRDETRPYYIC